MRRWRVAGVLLLALAANGAVVAGAWIIYWPAGLIVAGLSVLAPVVAVDWPFGDAKETHETSRRPPFA